ncbi:MAG: WecB/TagA/CpsF family glycosyltransferase [Verrucomicrobiia bacterium]
MKLYDKGHKSSVKEIVGKAKNNEHKNRLVSATGAHGLVTAKKNAEFKNILNKFYLNLPDGMPCVWVGRVKGARSMTRCYGPDIFSDVMIASANIKISHFLCGGKPGVAQNLKKACKNRFGNNNIVGLYSPPFRAMTDSEFQNLGDKINSSKANIVWIGLGTPKQELFAEKLSHFVSVDFIVTVGAAFDFHTGNVRQAPKFVQNIGMEWFFRLCMEPKRLWRRYSSVVPLFIYYSTLDLARRRNDNKNQ